MAVCEVLGAGHRGGRIIQIGAAASGSSIAKLVIALDHLLATACPPVRLAVGSVE